MLPFQVSQVGHQELLLEAVELLSALVRIISSLVGIVLYSTAFCLGDSQVFSNCRLHPLFTPNKETPISGFIADACMVIPNFVNHSHTVYIAFTIPLQSLIQDGISPSCVSITSFHLKCFIAELLLGGGGLTYRSDILASISAKCYEPRPQQYSTDVTDEIIFDSIPDCHTLHSQSIISTRNSRQPLMFNDVFCYK